MSQIQEIITRGVVTILPNKESLEKKLTDGKITIYLGIDPTATQIHLGHAVLLRKLRKFSEMGHRVIFLIGDFTALIGDTSDKDTERPVLTKEEIQNNFQTYKSQAEKILDFEKIEIRNNSEWLGTLTFEDIIKLAQHFSVGDFVSRELIKKRMEQGKRVGLHEILYPVMQGYDSMILEADLQIGGSDQIFNMQAGRTLQKDIKGRESFVLTTEFLEGTDGRKMSKSWGNAIWLNDSPNDIFGKVMSLKDELIIRYFLLATDVEMTEIEMMQKRLEEGENPMSLKKELARRIVQELHSEEEAIKAADFFETAFQKNEIPENIPSISGTFTGELLASKLIEHGIIQSKSEFTRLIEQGGVSINGEKVSDNFATINSGKSLIRIGKHRFFEIQSD